MRRLFNAQKAGHAGTLDPLATGILPIALGEATKTVPFLMDADKTYRFTIAWGATTATFDREGAVTATLRRAARRATQVEAALPRLRRRDQQIPPAFSAIKVDGERAYDLARAGRRGRAGGPHRDHPSPPRSSSAPDADHVEIEIDCGKGTYVRAIVRDLAERAGRLRPCQRPAPHPRGAVHRGPGDIAGKTGGFGA